MLYALVVGVASWAHAADDTPEPAAQTEARTVIALFDSDQQSYVLDTQDPVHETLELPLNHLGMVVRRHDVRDGPPPVEWLADARAVLTYFHGTSNAAEWLWPWLEGVVEPAGLRVVHVGEFGPLAVAEDGATLRRWLGRRGLGLGDEFAKGPLTVEVSFLDRQTCAFERDPRGEAVYAGPWIEDERNTAWVTVRRRATDARELAPVVVGDWGGIALDPWVMHHGTGVADYSDRAWHLDPFAFLRDALGLRGVPAPHPSVLNGRRMFFLHVDGDGFESRSTVDGEQLCGEVFRDHILSRWPVPMTVSVIVASLTDDLAPAEPTYRMRVASEILNHAHVEPASHSVLHPFWWTVPGTKEQAALGRAAFARLDGYEPSAEAEVTESLRFIDEQLLEGDRRCRVMLWSGDCVPPPSAIAAADAAGAVNLNGGIYRLDALHRTLVGVRGWGRLDDDQLQVYAGAPNENVFAGFFDRVPTAFRHVSASIEATGAERILKPANIYMHFYCVSSPARLTVLNDLLQRWVVDEPTVPVPASRYTRSVTSAVRTARVTRTDDGWSLSKFGDCRTARIDGESRDVDLTRSSGLIGWQRRGDSLYVHLGGPDAKVALASNAPRRPHVVEAGCELVDVSLSPDAVSFRAGMELEREVIVGGFVANESVRVAVGEKPTDARADANGQIVVRLPAGAPVLVEVRRP